MVVTFLFQKILQLKDCRHWPCVATYNIYMNCVRDVNHLWLEKQNYCNVSAVTLVPYQLEKQNYCNVREVTLALFRIVAAVRLAFALVVAHKCAQWTVRFTAGWHQCTHIARPYGIWPYMGVHMLASLYTPHTGPIWDCYLGPTWVHYGLDRMGPIWILYGRAHKGKPVYITHGAMWACFLGNLSSDLRKTAQNFNELENPAKNVVTNWHILCRFGTLVMRG